jgi:hypothetical protein
MFLFAEVRGSSQSVASSRSPKAQGMVGLPLVGQFRRGPLRERTICLGAAIPGKGASRPVMSIFPSILGPVTDGDIIIADLFTLEMQHEHAMDPDPGRAPCR